MVLDFLRRRRAFRARVGREATDLQLWLGEVAYDEARVRMRSARVGGDDSGDRLWSKVAVEIARRTEREIGKRGAERWPDAGRAAPPPAGSPRIPNRREIADRLVDISRAIVALSKGEAEAAEIHNIAVAARQILGFTGRSPALEQAVGELITACEGVAIAPTLEELTAGSYPATAEIAGAALQRLRALVLPAS